MDLRAIDFDWNQARAFLVTAEEGSFSAASQKLNLTQPTLGRQVRSLEQTLGVVLFEKLGRGLALTPSGKELFEYVRAMGEAASHISLTATGKSQEIEGTVGVSISETAGAHLMPRFIEKLSEIAPRITIDIIAIDTPSDLMKREADIAIRNFRPSEPDLIAKKIKDGSARLYAAHSLLERTGQPQTFEEFSKLPFVGFDRTPRFMEGLQERGLKITEDSFAALARNHIVHWELVKQGVGVGLVEEVIGTQEPLVAPILPEMEPFTFPIWLVSHRELKTSKRIRIVFDMLAEEIANW